MRLNAFTLACLSVPLLAGCGGATVAPSAQSSNTALLDAPHRTTSNSQTFDYTGSMQTFKVPAGVSRITVSAAGATGGDGTYSGSGAPGKGGLVTATIPVKAGEELAIVVGGLNGYNGGGAGPESSGSYYAGNGGGASDVREGGTALKDRVVIAGGGGGGGSIGYKMGEGGGGGLGGGKVGTAGGDGSSGYDGSGSGGGGGTHKAGGKGGAGGINYAKVEWPPRCRDGCGYCDGAAGNAGGLGTGGAAATKCGGPGGGGGGGYYGGGGGGSGSYNYFGVSFNYGAGGGGGGGSSYVEKHHTNLQSVTGGAPAGNGQVVISW